MHQEKKDNAGKASNSRVGVMVYPDGSLRVDPEVISRQYREQFKSSAQSNLEEEEWQERLKR